MYHLAKSLYMYATSKEEYSVLLLGLDNAGKTTLLSQIKALYSPPRSDGSLPASLLSTNIGKTVPTVGQNVATISLRDMYLKIWDVGGQISMRNLWQSYYSSCHAIIFVVDSTDVGQDPDITRLPQRRRSSNPAGNKTAAGGAAAAAEEEEEAEAWDNDDGGASDNDLGTASPTATRFTAESVGINAPGSDFGRLDECRQVLESVLKHADVAGVPILVLANKQDREDSVEVVRIKEGFVRKVFEGESGAGVRDSRVLPVSALMGSGVQEAVEWVQSRVKWNKEGRPPVMR
ncbi:ADP-ribosylation factor family protein [Aspergillus saccharolyticus JOP 1030-1]|uniref:GTP-binding ADP-ribosylation factor-like protein n=1 Tax=Aspergillus saccharolyticus JOP 1030-1 TaxID=1450539 RepID=A0A318ZS41_9EURO|nr:GTP-binding ADP-ribosylation factor-like protein [Aspergillus saccharolyticus JOP 1030-1]PYH49434.1 GTP-binding ADP-ribosylation factor-like protein [Aspergillus saccharolyticus JOP 1030-1]